MIDARDGVAQGNTSMSSLIWADGLSFNSTNELFKVSVPNGDVRADSILIGINPSQRMGRPTIETNFHNGTDTIYAREQSGFSGGGFVLRGPFCDRKGLEKWARRAAVYPRIRGDVTCQPHRSLRFRFLNFAFRTILQSCTTIPHSGPSLVRRLSGLFSLSDQPCMMMMSTTRARVR